MTMLIYCNFTVSLTLIESMKNKFSIKRLNGTLIAIYWSYGRPSYKKLTDHFVQCCSKSAILTTIYI